MKPCSPNSQDSETPEMEGADLITRLRWAPREGNTLLHLEAANWIEKLERENLELQYDVERVVKDHAADLSARSDINATLIQDIAAAQGWAGDDIRWAGLWKRIQNAAKKAAPQVGRATYSPPITVGHSEKPAESAAAVPCVVKSPSPEALHAIIGGLCDEENQPHQWIGAPADLYKDLGLK